MKNEEAKPKLDMNYMRLCAIKEYGYLMKKINALQNKAGGSTGFLLNVENKIADILLDFLKDFQ